MLDIADMPKWKQYVKAFGNYRRCCNENRSPQDKLLACRRAYGVICGTRQDISYICKHFGNAYRAVRAD